MLIENPITSIDKSKATKIMMYIIQHADMETHVFSRTYKQMQADLQVSEMSLAHVFKIFESLGALENVGRSKWLVHVIEETTDDCEGPDFYVTALE